MHAFQERLVGAALDQKRSCATLSTVRCEMWMEGIIATNIWRIRLDPGSLSATDLVLTFGDVFPARGSTEDFRAAKASRFLTG